MTTPRAADLPVGSVVVTTSATFLKVDAAGIWRSTTGEPLSRADNDIDSAPGAKVSRLGYGVGCD